jgi:hypothetical protein
MKKQMINAFARKFFLGNVMAAMMFLSANASVSPVYNKYEPATKNKAAITYKGMDSELFLAFNVVYNNTTGNPFNLRIADPSGELLYAETFKDVQFNKTFKVQKDAISKLNFTIRDEKTGVTENFEINVTANVVENITVARKN